ncbi:hypothetical protein DICPUDRAFT_53679 [Dictyostelium purpureum]|uniref:Uncharacterized protein n=1 Tax=Dictyostelium purpureum TaxID=5786 RepID=F0ZDU8_DICPU|nr:uncharacterized protein DICPUDRAFT_53679 [Dictyostelium purpureum]EGC37865.1 hypothetical protein DICPUDRAFT_53679 [Dictyostelium purpureum]|eukprot:XP_003285615.1 hypothetical protein DICPUDRAFT_53679 [Dictyostelium purpureum]
MKNNIFFILLFLILFTSSIDIVKCINNNNNNNNNNNHYKIQINSNYNTNYRNNNNNNNNINSFNNGLKILQNKNIGCEIHSWNDLNEFDQMYAKGVIWNKIDVHFVYSKEFCMSQGLNDSRGCFVFSHDTPSINYQYNNTLDLLKYIESRKDIWYSVNSISNTLKYMDFCFKAHFSVCGNSKEARDYNELLDEFILDLLDIKEKLQLNIEFVLDGKGIQIDCLKDKWDPLISTWIDEPFGALFSNDPSKGYDRFQVADIYIAPIFPSFWIDVLCLFHPPFGKFHNSSYPILVWEPASQHDIQAVSSSYHSCLARHSDLQFPELRFASNIDPIQLSLYAGSVSNKTWNFKIDDYGLTLRSAYEPPIDKKYTNLLKSIKNSNSLHGNNFYSNITSWLFSNNSLSVNTPTASTSTSSTSSNLQNLINPKIISYQFNNLNHFIVFFTNDSSPTTSVYYHLFNSDQILGRLNYLNTFKLDIPNNSAFKSPINTINLINNSTLFIIDNQSNYLIYNTGVTDTSFEILDYNSLKINTTEDDPGTVNTFDFIIDNNNDLTIIEYLSTNVNLLSTNIWYFDKLTIPINNIPKYKSKILISHNSSSSDSINKNSPPITSISAINRNKEGVDTVLLFSNDKKEIYGVYLKMNSTGNNSTYSDFGIVNGPNMVDIGDQLSSTVIDNDLVIQVHSDGYCFNSELHNKRAGPRVCESSATSTPRILNYNFGYFDDWVEQIKSKEMITSCNNKILHGTYNQGSFPSVHLYKEINGTVNNLGLKYGVVEVHQGLPLDFIDRSNCGRPTSWDQIVLDSWKILPDFLKLNQKINK